MAVDIDNFLEMTVKETQPNIKGDTSGGGGKPATMETGLVVTVPFHIKEGDVLKIDTREGKYMEKVKWRLDFNAALSGLINQIK